MKVEQLDCQYLHTQVRRVRRTLFIFFHIREISYLNNTISLIVRYLAYI